MIVSMELPDGQIVEAFFFPSDYPRFGESREFEGPGGEILTGTRVPSMSRESAIVHRDRSFVSTQTPKFDPLAPRHTKEGYAAFASRKEAVEYAAKVNDRNSRAGNGMTIGLE